MADLGRVEGDDDDDDDDDDGHRLVPYTLVNSSKQHICAIFIFLITTMEYVSFVLVDSIECLESVVIIFAV